MLYCLINQNKKAWSCLVLVLRGVAKNNNRTVE
jgi:hypothetical protein